MRAELFKAVLSTKSHDSHHPALAHSRLAEAGASGAGSSVQSDVCRHIRAPEVLCAAAGKKALCSWISTHCRGVAGVLYGVKQMVPDSTVMTHTPLCAPLGEL